MNNYEKNISIIKNCISVKEQNLIENYVSNSNFYWNYYEGTILKDDLYSTNYCVIEKGINPPQFCHIVSMNKNSNLIFFQNIFNFLSAHYNCNLHILKCKINLLMQNTDNTHHYPHADIDNFDEDIRSAIYYINDSDGETYFFNEFAPKQSNIITTKQKIFPKKGSILLFDSRRFHSSSSPISSKRRMVLNITFRLPKE